MKKILVITLFSICLFAFRKITDKKPEQTEIHDAIQKGLFISQKSSHEFIENAGCFSCHGQCLGAIAFTMGKEKGFVVYDSILSEALQLIQTTNTDLSSYFTEHIELQGANVTYTYALWALSSSHIPSSKSTAMIVHQLLDRQNKDGYWAGGNGRAPLEYYAYSATALAISALNNYTMPGFKNRTEIAKKRAKTWLINTPAINNEEKIFQLLGLKWVNADPGFIKKQAKILLSHQHADGGWSQLDSLTTDAYATGQSLYALNQVGELDVNDKAYQRGIAFLLNTQHEDGSWRVKSRTVPAIPYVSSGFPYGDDQFISAAGTNWATMALLLSIK